MVTRPLLGVVGLMCGLALTGSSGCNWSGGAKSKPNSFGQGSNMLGSNMQGSSPNALAGRGGSYTGNPTTGPTGAYVGNGGGAASGFDRAGGPPSFPTPSTGTGSNNYGASGAGGAAHPYGGGYGASGQTPGMTTGMTTTPGLPSTPAMTTSGAGGLGMGSSPSIMPTGGMDRSTAAGTGGYKLPTPPSIPTSAGLSSGSPSIPSSSTGSSGSGTPGLTPGTGSTGASLNTTAQYPPSTAETIHVVPGGTAAGGPPSLPPLGSSSGLPTAPTTSSLETPVNRVPSDGTGTMSGAPLPNLPSAR
jgi:hypothetical protein